VASPERRCGLFEAVERLGAPRAARRASRIPCPQSGITLPSAEVLNDVDEHRKLGTIDRVGVTDWLSELFATSFRSLLP
jgi:hypothetical protein